MVTRGQLLERPVIVPAQGTACLDGIYLRGESPAVLLASPLAHRGGCMALPVLSEIAYAAAYAGVASLRLDYRGVGASEGELSRDVGDAAVDLGFGLEFMLETVGGMSVVAAGYASGCWAAVELAAREPRIESLLLVSDDRRDRPDLPSYADLKRPVMVVEAGEDPALSHAEVSALVDAAPMAHLKVIPGAGRHFREGLAKLAALVPPLLGRDRRE